MRKTLLSTLLMLINHDNETHLFKAPYITFNVYIFSLASVAFEQH